MALFHRKLLPELFVYLDKKTDNDEKYESCYDCYLCPDECNVYASPPPPPPPSPKHQMSIIIILMICFLGAGFICFSYVIIRRYRLSLRGPRRRASSPMENNDFREDFIDENQGPVVDHHIWYIRTVGLPQSVIDSIPVFNYRREEKLADGSDCSVCLNEFEENESLRLLPKCSHAFHVPCIDTWLRSHKNCPVCRSPILINNINTSMEINSSNSGSREENGLENRPELETDEITEMRDVTENAVELHIEDDKMAELFSNNWLTNIGRNGKFRVLSDLADRRKNMDQELEPVRRSVSMDYSSASMIYNAMAETHAKKDEGCSDTKLSRIEKQNLALISNMGSKNSSVCRLIKSSSYGILQQKGPISMKRSFSFSGKYSLRNHEETKTQSLHHLTSSCKTTTYRQALIYDCQQKT